jgi:CDGSH-type Zn-finger protein
MAKIVVTKNGPYLVSGSVPIAKETIVLGRDGNPEKWVKGDSYPVQESCALCRCGGSGNKPYCDGTHAKIKFNGTETANRESYEKQAEKVVGPKLVMTDAQSLCSVARFCHRAGGAWELTEKSDDPKCKENAIRDACDCPSGRLVAWEKGRPIEPKFKQSISLVEDPGEGVSGPLWVKGGIPIESADGKKHEARNRVTLCRCGQSHNKPFCDGSHIAAGFDDGDKSLKKGKK